METNLKQNIDVFANPFKNLDMDRMKILRNRSEEVYYFVTDHTFKIVSETETSEKTIVWMNSNLRDAPEISDMIFENRNWDTIYTWAEGTANLRESEADSAYLYLNIGHHECDTPNLLLCAPFLYEVSSDIENTVTAYNNRNSDRNDEWCSFFQVNFLGFWPTNLKEITKPLNVLKRSRWMELRGK